MWSRSGYGERNGFWGDFFEVKGVDWTELRSLLPAWADSMEKGPKDGSWGYQETTKCTWTNIWTSLHICCFGSCSNTSCDSVISSVTSRRDAVAKQVRASWAPSCISSNAGSCITLHPLPPPPRCHHSSRHKIERNEEIRKKVCWACARPILTNSTHRLGEIAVLWET